MNYTEDQLKAALVRASPEKLGLFNSETCLYYWKDQSRIEAIKIELEALK